MDREQAVVRLMSDYHGLWHEHFARLHRRAQWHIVHHLCTEGRDGAPVGELYGLVKQVFLLDDATVKDRIGDLTAIGLCSLDPPDTKIAARTVVLPLPVLLETFDKHLLAFDVRLEEIAAAIDPELRPRRVNEIGDEQRLLLLEAVAVGLRACQAAFDRIFDQTKLSKARRLEARRNLISTSHRTLVQTSLEYRYGLAGLTEEDEDGILADRMAATLLDLTGQNFQTTRDHIAYLIELGLLERKRGRSLRIALSDAAAESLHQSLGEAAASLPAVVRRLHETLPARGAADEPTLMIPRRGSIPAEEWEHELVILRPADAAQRISVMIEPLTIGRSAPSGLILSDSQISRAHCTVEAAGGAVVITDLNSTNGTFVEGKRIHGRAALEPGAILEIGPYRLRYHRRGSAVVSSERETDGTIRVAPARESAE